MYKLIYGQGEIKLKVPNISDIYLIEIIFMGNIIGTSNMPGSFIPCIGEKKLMIVNGDVKHTTLSDECIIYYDTKCKIKYCRVFELSELQKHNENNRLRKESKSIALEKVSLSRSVTVVETSAKMNKLDTTWDTLSDATDYNYDNTPKFRKSVKSHLVVNNAKFSSNKKYYKASGEEYNGPIHYHSDLKIMTGGTHTESSELLYATADKLPLFPDNLVGKSINLKGILNQYKGTSKSKKIIMKKLKKHIKETARNAVYRSPKAYLKMNSSPDGSSSGGGSTGGY